MGKSGGIGLTCKPLTAIVLKSLPLWGRVESWRSSEGPISSSPSSNRACDFPAHGFPIIFGQRLSPLSLALWYSLLQSSRTLPEFIACAISCPSLLQKHDESIAPSLSQSFAALRSKRYYGQLRLPNRPEGISFPYIPPLLSSTAPARVSRATPPDFPCVSPLLPRKPTSPFWQFSLRPVSQPSPNVHRVGNSTFNYEATYRFACAATRRFARLPEGAFVRELCASGYPPHLPPATWANC